MALDLLEKAIRLNQDCKKMAMTDEDFINMRETEPFRLLVT